MTPTILRGLWRAPRLNLRAQRMGRRSASLKGSASAQEAFDALLVNATAAPQQPRQDDQPFTWTILLSVFLQGLTGRPLSNRYGRTVATWGPDVAEALAVPDASTRRRTL